MMRLIFIFLMTLGLASCAGDENLPRPQPAPNLSSPTPAGLPCPLGRTTARSALPVSADASPASDVEKVGRIRFDPDLSPQERGAFVAAMEFLDSLTNVRSNSDLLRFMRISRFDSPNVRAWLEERVQYIVPDSVGMGRVKTLETGYSGYENPGSVPGLLQGCLTNASESKVVMSNVGTMMYLIGKVKKVLFGLDTDGTGVIPLRSPRTGILKAGEGLFILKPEYKTLVKIFHLTTLIHEARHSDGNRETTGFLHENCVGGDYAGQPACDHNLNGPYEIESLAIRDLMSECRDCSLREAQLLRLLYLDTAGRVIQDAQTTEWDDAPEGRR